MCTPKSLEAYIIDKLNIKREKLLKSWKYGLWIEFTVGMLLTIAFMWVLLRGILTEHGREAVPLYTVAVVFLLMNTFSKVANCIHMQEAFGDDFMKNNILPLKFMIEEHNDEMLKLDNGEIKIDISTPKKVKGKKVEVLFEITDYKLTNYYIA